MDYESFRPLDGAHDRLSTLILAASMALALGFIGCATDRARFESEARIQPLQAQLAIEHAQGLARCYWQQKLAKAFNHTLPVVILCKDEAELLARVKAEKLPWQTVQPKKANTEYFGFTNREIGRVYLRTDADYSDFLHEAGHWYLQLDCDEADKFSAWALKQRLKRFPILEK